MSLKYTHTHMHNKWPSTTGQTSLVAPVYSSQLTVTAQKAGGCGSTEKSNCNTSICTTTSTCINHSKRVDISSLLQTWCLYDGALGSSDGGCF